MTARDRLLTSSMMLALPRPRVFAFFAEAANLETITPPELRFRILTPQPVAMGRGTQIDDEVRYRLPWEPATSPMAPLVHWQLERIFRYRERRVRQVLEG